MVRISFLELCEVNKQLPLFPQRVLDLLDLIKQPSCYFCGGYLKLKEVNPSPIAPDLKDHTWVCSTDRDHKLISYSQGQALAKWVSPDRSEYIIPEDWMHHV